MKKLTHTVLATLVATTLCSVAFAAQQSNDGGRNHDRPWSRGHDAGGEFGDPAAMIERMSKHLTLTDDQELAVNNIMDSARPEFESLRTRSDENREAMRSLVVGSSAYAVTLQNLATEAGQLATDRVMLQGRIRAEVHAVMTPEQQQQMAETAAQMREEFGKRPRRGRQ